MTSSAADLKFRRLYDAHHRQVLAYFLRRTDRESAYECTEDVFLVAWRKLDDIPEGEQALAWLYGAAWRVLANHHRRVNRHMRLIDRMRKEPLESATEPEHQVVRNAEAVEVLAAVESLSSTDQEVLRLAVWEELPHAEIASILGCSTNAVDVRLHRAIKRLGKGLYRSRHKHGRRPAFLPGEE